MSRESELQRHRGLKGDLVEHELPCDPQDCSRDRGCRWTIDCPTANLAQAKTPSSLPTKRGGAPHGLHTKTRTYLRKEGRNRRSQGRAPRPSVKGWDMTPVMQGSVNDACEEPLRPRRGVWENCAGHGCPSLHESDLDFVLPSAMKGLR